LDDFRPYIFKTTDYGRTWRKLVAGIPDDHFIRVVREDPVRRGLLYAGGEFGLYVSFDDGAGWQSLQRNLPIVPIHDLAVKDNDLVAATHGRASPRSEEHTSELQSRRELVCRLLLEKKNRTPDRS